MSEKSSEVKRFGLICKDKIKVFKVRFAKKTYNEESVIVVSLNDCTTDIQF